MSGIAEQIRTVIDSLNEPPKEPEPQQVLSRRRFLRLFVWGGMAAGAATLAGWSIYEQNRKAQESPWEKLDKLGPDEIYLYSGTATVIPEANFFTSNGSSVPMNGREARTARYAPVIPPEKEGYDPKKDSRVGFITEKGLLFVLGEFVTIEGGSFIKAKKTNKPGEFIGPNGDIINTKPVK